MSSTPLLQADQIRKGTHITAMGSDTPEKQEIDSEILRNGHTASDVIVIFTGSNVVHLGDLFNSGNWSFPYVDLDLGGSIDGLVRNVKSILEIISPDAVVIPGHYELTDREGLKATYDMLLETIGIVREKIVLGKDLNQIKAEGFPAAHDSWGKGETHSAKWIENIFDGLSKE